MMKTILVVDDSAVMRQMLLVILEESGYCVLLADGGQPALGYLQREHVDLVLTDWTVAPMDGGALTCQLRQLDNCAHIPVVVLSTFSGDTYKSDARKAGANGWLSKPVQPQTLLDVISSLLTMGQP